MARVKTRPRRKRRPATSSKPLDQDAAIRLLRQFAQGWLALDNINSVGVGYKVTKGKRTNRLSIQVTVNKKWTESELRKLDIAPLPRTLNVPGGGTLPVDVLERRYKQSYVIVQPQNPTPPPLPMGPGVDPRIVRRRRQVRIMPGISVGATQPDVLAGTIGAIVYDNRSGRPCVLSNSHVLGGQVGDPVIQPGRNDDDDINGNVLGRLLRSHIGLAGDCAIAAIETRFYDERIFELNIKPTQIAKVELDDRVIKSGRTTGVTRGIVVRVGVVLSYDYGPSLGVRQIGCFEIGPEPIATPGAPISDNGDSGSPWLIESNGAVTDILVGLHFAAQEDPFSGNEHALACNIHSVFEKLDVSLTTNQ